MFDGGMDDMLWTLATVALVAARVWGHKGALFKTVAHFIVCIQGCRYYYTANATSWALFWGLTVAEVACFAAGKIGEKRRARAEGTTTIAIDYYRAHPEALQDRPM